MKQLFRVELTGFAYVYAEDDQEAMRIAEADGSDDLEAKAATRRDATLRPKSRMDLTRISRMRGETWKISPESGKRKVNV